MNAVLWWWIVICSFEQVHLFDQQFLSVFLVFFKISFQWVTSHHQCTEFDQYNGVLPMQPIYKLLEPLQKFKSNNHIVNGITSQLG